MTSDCPTASFDGFSSILSVIILDGGLGLIKVSFMRFLHINLMKNLRTPIHDHMRKNKDWSDTQVVFRFTIVQIILGLAVIYGLMF